MGQILHPERLRGVHPQLVLIAQAWRVQLAFDVLICQGVRTDAEQLWLYEQGRSRAGRIVTNARNAALSAHGRRFFNGGAYGCALDAAPCRDGVPQWNDMDGLQAMAAIAQRMGATWGGTFKSIQDFDHFEFPPDWRDVPPAPDSTPAPQDKRQGDVT